MLLAFVVEQFPRDPSFAFLPRAQSAEILCGERDLILVELENQSPDCNANRIRVAGAWGDGGVEHEGVSRGPSRLDVVLRLRLVSVSLISSRMRGAA